MQKYIRVAHSCGQNQIMYAPRRFIVRPVSVRLTDNGAVRHARQVPLEMRNLLNDFNEVSKANRVGKPNVERVVKQMRSIILHPYVRLPDAPDWALLLPPQGVRFDEHDLRADVKKYVEDYTGAGRILREDEWGNLFIRGDYLCRTMTVPAITREQLRHHHHFIRRYLAKLKQ